MTRINCIPPHLLIDQHLLAEYHEMFRMPWYLQKSLDTGRPISVPLMYKMGKGHVKFFYDKGLYLKNRHKEIKEELTKRGYVLNLDLDLSSFPGHFMNDWEPPRDAMLVNIERLATRIREVDRPRYCGEDIGVDEFLEMVSPCKENHRGILQGG